jgi:hypothetical protein
VALPYTAIPDILAPDDVLSYQHMNRLVDRANEADEALARQHWGRYGSLTNRNRSGQHMGVTPGAAIGVMIVRPGVNADISVPNSHAVTMRAGYVAGDGEWLITTYNNEDYYRFRCSAPGSDYTWYGADVQVGFSGTPDSTAPSNMMCIHPRVETWPQSFGTGDNVFRRWFCDVHFGKTDVDLILQFTVILVGGPEDGGVFPYTATVSP